MENQGIVIWLHMHQPSYFHPIMNIQYLPWVRRNLTKGYYNVAKILSNYSTKVNINFSGILLKQIMDYQESKITDYYQLLETKDAACLTESEKIFIINHFLINGLMNDSARYKELFEKKIHLEHFSIQDIRDAQFLFSLSAMSTLLPETTEFKKKERNFTEYDKKQLHKIETDIINSVLPMYKDLYEKGQIELTVTPFYHPILPLLINSTSAKESKNDAVIPENIFSHVEDADTQIKMAINIFKNVFGKKPKGMWPSEGSVSDDAANLIHENGLSWIGTDESVLKKSIGNDDDSLIWYLNETKILFRDHSLSDKIGFVYNKMEPAKAAEDFYNEAISKGRTEVVILDGENPWEYYKNGGIEFLNEWFKKIENIAILGSEAETKKYLNHITPGSWINGYFDTWIGHKESNIAWTYLTEARERLKGSRDALQELYIAEGSDWFWWYSDFHKNEVDMSFDTLFRAHISKAYYLANIKTPDYLNYPIKEVK
jgi:alpha-amylase/alpha-mannosidase (GH57 family)